MLMTALTACLAALTERRGTDLHLNDDGAFVRMDGALQRVPDISPSVAYEAVAELSSRCSGEAPAQQLDDISTGQVRCRVLVMRDSHRAVLRRVPDSRQMTVSK